MSGSAGGNRIIRSSVAKTVEEYINKVLSKFPGFKGAKLSGSYNTGTKNNFGDIDLVVNLTATDKKNIKAELAKYISSLPDDVIVPFKSDKYKGKKFLNTGEIITILYPIEGQPDEYVQIDNIISISDEEAEFKKEFLDYPAEIQGLMLGLAKIICLEEDPKSIFARMGIKNIPALEPNQEYEFNLSSAGLTLRIVTLDNFKETDKTDVWKTSNWPSIKKLFTNYNIDGSWEDLLSDLSSKLQNPRSKNRIKGLFNSMVSIKSGEVGTPKGNNKQKALDKVNSTLSETNLGRYLASILLEEQNPTIALFPGAFKPPHKGHFNVVKQLLQRADQVVILISPKTREGVTADESVAVWNLYKTKLDGSVEIKISEMSPVKETYNVVTDNPGTNFIVAFGKGEIDRYKTMDEYPNVTVFDAGEVEGVNATGLRMALLKDNNEEEIKEYLPEDITVEEFMTALGKPIEPAEPAPAPTAPAEPVPAAPVPEEPLQESPPLEFEQDDYQDYTLQNRHKIEKAAYFFNLPISDMEYAFNAGREVVLNDDIWSKLENSKSYKMKSLDDAIQHALKLGIDPKPYIDFIKEGKEMPLPLVLCYAQDKYYLVGGEVVLSLYRALGSIPSVIQGTLNLKTNVPVEYPVVVKENFYSKKIQEDIKSDIEYYGMISEYQINLDDVYDYSRNNNFFVFHDDINNFKVIAKTKQQGDLTEFKFYNVDENGKMLGFNNVKHYNPKVMNTIFKIFLNEVLPNYNKILIQPAGYTRYRLFRALINNKLSKNDFNIQVKDEIDQPYIIISKQQNNIKEGLDKKINSNIIKEFIKFAVKELGITRMPEGLTLSYNTNTAKDRHSFGTFDPNDGKIWLYVKNRNMADILRTLAHELVHRKQDEDGRIDYTSGNTGSEIENEANAKAGILLRKFGKNNENIYENKK